MSNNILVPDRKILRLSVSNTGFAPIYWRISVKPKISKKSSNISAREEKSIYTFQRGLPCLLKSEHPPICGFRDD